MQLRDVNHTFKNRYLGRWSPVGATRHNVPLKQTEALLEEQPREDYTAEDQPQHVHPHTVIDTMDSDSDGAIRRSGDDSYRERGEVEAERYRSRTRSQSRSGSADDSRRGAGNRSGGRRERDRSPEIEQAAREQAKELAHPERKVGV